MQNKEIVIDDYEIPVRPSTGGKHKLTPKERDEIIASVEQAGPGVDRFYAYISKATEILNRAV